MKKSDIKVMPEYFDRYINEVEDIELNEALGKYGSGMFFKEKNNFEKIADRVYSPGKWTIKDILQHLIDAERIFNYRALTFARKDKTALPGFEENFYAEVSGANKRTFDDLLNEFDDLRKSTVSMFNSFDEQMLNSEGMCFNKDVSVLSIGFILAGHPLHHFNVIKEKYFPLI